MNKDYVIKYENTNDEIEDFLNEVIGSIGESYYESEGWMRPTTIEYYRGVIDTMYRFGKLTEPERLVYNFMLDQLSNRGNGE